MSASQAMSTERHSWSSTVKEEFDDKQYNANQNSFRCSHCSERYPNSTLLVQHMRLKHLHVAESRVARIPDKIPAAMAINEERYQNTSAICPFCRHDCNTRKKLMRHLELEHKDDNEQHDGPNVKVIRIESLDEGNRNDILSQLHNTGPFVTPGSSQSRIVQNLLRAIGTPGNNIAGANAKVDNKAANKLQYKCFWCDSSFRKRGKLMDHIDTLHKDNKQQNQAEADRLSVADPNKSQFARPMLNPHNMAMSPLGISKYPASMPGYVTVSQQHTPIQHRSTLTESRPKSNNGNTFSFTLAGSLATKYKPSVEEPAPKSPVCKFYLGKKDNPLANVKASTETVGSNFSPRRFSLPNLMDSSCSTSSPYNFPYRMMQPANTMAAAMQQSYMLNMRPPLLNATQFYAPRMQMMMPSSEYLVNHAHPMLEHQSQSTQHAQFLARMALAQMSPLARPKPTESPLDLTKSHLA